MSSREKVLENVALEGSRDPVSVSVEVTSPEVVKLTDAVPASVTELVAVRVETVNSSAVKVLSVWDASTSEVRQLPV